MATLNARQRLIDAAAELVHARGYNAVGVQEVCEAANANKGSFYHYFESKEALMEAVLAERRNGFHGFLESAAGQARAIAMLSMLYDMFALAAAEQHSRSGHVTGCPIGSLAAETSTQSERIRHAACDVLGDFTATTEHLVARAADEGDLTLPIEPNVLAPRLVAYIQGAILLAKSKNDPSVMRELRGGYLHLLGLEGAKER